MKASRSRSTTTPSRSNPPRRAGLRAALAGFVARAQLGPSREQEWRDFQPRH
jgi:hypothetical protein